MNQEELTNSSVFRLCSLSGELARLIHFFKNSSYDNIYYSEFARKKLYWILFKAAEIKDDPENLLLQKLKVATYECLLSVKMAPYSDYYELPRVKLDQFLLIFESIEFIPYMPGGRIHQQISSEIRKVCAIGSRD